METVTSREAVAFAHVDNVRFPLPCEGGLNVNMMPFIMGEKHSLPENLHGYWDLIQRCVATLQESMEDDTELPRQKNRVGYLTVQESVVQGGNSQRRPGLHTEGFTRAPFDSGCITQLPVWHGWGFGHALRTGKFQGGIFMASNVSGSCNVYNVIVPQELVGKGGDVEHLRSFLNEHFPDQPKPRTRMADDIERLGRHAGCAYGHMHMEGHAIGYQQPVKGPISLQARELIWMTDRTPHESVPLEIGGLRQFFRLVTGGIDTWFAAHSTPNPLGIQPEAKIVAFNKFT